MVVEIKITHMRKQKIFRLMTPGLCVLLFLLSIHTKAQEAVHKHAGHSGSAEVFTDKDALAKMVKNFESAERDSMQQPAKVLQYLGDIKGKKIMDIGAGTGYFSVRFAINGAYVIAADVSEGFLSFLKNRMKEEKISNMELRKVPYDSPLLKDKEVDIVFMSNTYHHIENRITYFTNVKQGLKTDGELIIVDFFKAEFMEKVQAPSMTMRASVDEVVFELKKAGFKLFEIEVNLLPYQYIIKARG